MANLLPTVDIFRHRISRLRYSKWQVEGKRNNFVYYTQRLFFCKFVVGFQQFYFDICFIWKLLI